ncbi:MAG: hypothetical protein ACOCUR_00255 [Nanoarchaeota archaeon]
MGLDNDDAPVGEIVALVLVVATIFIVLVLTFDSCAEFEYGDDYRFCGDVGIEIYAPLGAERPCFNDDGEVVFQILNNGAYPVEFINIRYYDTNRNVSEYIGVLDQVPFKTDLGLRVGQEFRPINVTPIVYNTESEDHVLCERSMVRITKLDRC